MACLPILPFTHHLDSSSPLGFRQPPACLLQSAWLCLFFRMFFRSLRLHDAGSAVPGILLVRRLGLANRPLHAVPQPLGVEV